MSSKETTSDVGVVFCASPVFQALLQEAHGRSQVKQLDR